MIDWLTQLLNPDSRSTEEEAHNAHALEAQLRDLDARLPETADAGRQVSEAEGAALPPQAGAISPPPRIQLSASEAFDSTQADHSPAALLLRAMEPAELVGLARQVSLTEGARMLGGFSPNPPDADNPTGSAPLLEGGGAGGRSAVSSSSADGVSAGSFFESARHGALNLSALNAFDQYMERDARRYDNGFSLF